MSVQAQVKKHYSQHIQMVRVVRKVAESVGVDSTLHQNRAGMLIESPVGIFVENLVAMLAESPVGILAWQMVEKSVLASILAGHLDLMLVLTEAGNRAAMVEIQGGRMVAEAVEATREPGRAHT